MSDSRYVQYGCGWSAPRDWRNFDASPTLRFERLPVVGRWYTKNRSRFPENVEYGDIMKGLPVAPGSCRGVYCSHVLEHLSLDGLRVALRNTYLILSRCGVFRLVVPDLELSAQRYLADSSARAAPTFMRETGLGRESRATGPTAFLASWLGNAQHFWMWDYSSFEAELRSAGFVDIRRASFGDASDAMFLRVEAQERWDDCLGIECRRPDPRRPPVSSSERP